MESYHAPPAAPQWPLRPGQQLPPLPLAMRPLVASKALGISPRTLWSMTKRGEIPHAKVGGCTLYPTAAIVAWLAEITAHPPVKRPEAAEGGEA
jgi:predicted DNA-binding transcriptional regulator AlpA